MAVLPKLKKINLNDPSARQLAFLEELPELNKLILRKPMVRDYAGLRRLTKLKTLWLVDPAPYEMALLPAVGEVRITDFEGYREFLSE